MKTQPVTYVCLLSDYAVASAQAIKHIRPMQVIAVSSPKMKTNGNQDRFEELLKEWEIPVMILGSC